MSEVEKTIDITPTWKATARILITLFENGSEEGIAEAKAELLRMGGLMDTLIDERNAKFIADTDTEAKPSNDDEKNITKQFGCYSAELNIERDGADLVSWCHVSTTRNGVDYCSSLGVVETYGTIENAFGGEDIKVPESVVGRIQRWADANGY